MFRDGFDALRDGFDALRDEMGVLRDEFDVLRDGFDALQNGIHVLQDGIHVFDFGVYLVLKGLLSMYYGYFLRKSGNCWEIFRQRAETVSQRGKGFLRASSLTLLQGEKGTESRWRN